MTGLLAEVISRIYFVTHQIQKIYSIERVDGAASGRTGTALVR